MQQPLSKVWHPAKKHATVMTAKTRTPRVCPEPEQRPLGVREQLCRSAAYACCEPMRSGRSSATRTSATVSSASGAPRVPS